MLSASKVLGVPAHATTVRPFDLARPWLVRAIWVILPLTVGIIGDQALRGETTLLKASILGLGMLGWGAGLLALLVPHPLGLTVLRLLAPALVVAGIAMPLSEEIAPWQKAVVLVSLVLACLAIVSAETATWCVDGPAYPNESRHALSVPPKYFVLMVTVCVLTTCSVIAAIVLVASKQWIVGAVVAAVAAILGWLGPRSVHQLSRRFVVFVPAGFVVHDPIALLDPVLFRRSIVERIGPASMDTDSLDLTMGSVGTPLEVLLEEKVELAKLSDDRKTADVGQTARFLVSPMRPGAVLREAAARNYPVG